MIHKYKVAGMTCNGCKASIEKAIENIEGIKDFKVDLKKSQITIDSEKLMSSDSIQSFLPTKYHITESNIIGSEISNKSDFQQLKPLFIIFGYIIMTSILLHYKSWTWNGFMLDFMGLFYIVFSFFKILDLKGFPESFKMYDPLAKVIPSYAFVYPFIELALGLLFLMRIQVPLALITTIIILGVTTIGVTKTLLDKKEIQCACLGTVLKLPMTKATFIENTIMIVMAIIMLVNMFVS